MHQGWMLRPASAMVLKYVDDGSMARTGSTGTDPNRAIRGSAAAASPL